MIPEVAAVVAAAEMLVDTPGVVPPDGELARAVEALRMRRTRAAGSPTYEETDRTWGEVTAGDEILSVKTQKWYEVSSSVTDDRSGKVKVHIKGSPKPILRELTDPVRVKRGVLGDAADMFQLLWSGQSRAEHVGTQGIGPMIGVTEESDDD